MGAVCSRNSGQEVKSPSSHADTQDTGQDRGQNIGQAPPAPENPQNALKPGAPQPAPSTQSLPQQEVERPNQHLENLKVVGKIGVKATWTLCDMFKDKLPFPGGAGVALIGEIAGLVSTAIANKENLKALHGRTQDLIVVIVGRDLDVDALQTNQSKEVSRLYTNHMHRLLDLLKGIKDYAQNYCDRNFFLKLMMTKHDRDNYEEMVDALGKLEVDALFSVSVQTYSKVQEMHGWTAEMKSMLEDFRKETPYVDHATKIKEEVKSLGGIEAVKKDPYKLRQVAQHLDPGQQVVLETIESQVCAGFEAAFAGFDNGVHKSIKHTDMRTFWRARFDKKQKVYWDVWWLNFPEHLREIMIEERTVKEIESRFSDESAKRKFQEFVSRGNPSERIDVAQVHHAFPFWKQLLDVIDEALGLVVANQGPSPSLLDGQTHPDRLHPTSTAPIFSSMPHATSVKRIASLSPRPGQEHTVHSHVRCSLPYLDRLYRGRDQDAAIVEHKLQAQLDRNGGNCKAAICLKASAGMGKSMLGLDVGWRMAMSGKCPAGVQMADMREAWSYEEVLGRFCSTLGMTMDENTTDEIPAKLGSLCHECGGPMMLLVDNAEDPLTGKKDLAGKPEASKGPAKFMSLIAKIAREAVLLITSRVQVESPCSITHHELGGMDVESCQALLRETLMQETAPSLSDSQIVEVVHICRGVPLLVRLAGDALRTGQLSVEEVRQATEKDSNATTAITKLMIQTLPVERQQYLALLATFPAGFDEEGAAAVLNWDMPRASSLLVLLWNHGLVAWDVSYNTYSLHSMVRTCAVELVRRAMPAVVRQAQIRFVIFTFHQMDKQALIYNTTAWEAPLAWVREHGPDIRAAFALAWELLRSPDSHGLLETVLGVDIESVRPMLRAGGIRYSSTWFLLDRMDGMCGGNELLLSAALYVSNLLRRHEHGDIEKALQIRERLLHNDDPRTLSCLHALAQTRHLQTRYSLAERLYRKAKEARHRVLGPNHPHTLDSVEGFAECIADLGRYTEAEPLLKEVVKGREEVLGKLHPRTLESNTNVANCFGKQGHQAAAEELHRKNLQARYHVLGPDHLKTYDCKQCLAICLRQQGKTAEAQCFFEETLKGRQRILGKDNPATYDTLNSYANCVSDEGNDKKAEGLYREVLEAREKWSQRMHGEGALPVFECKNNLADSLRAQGKHDEAEAMYREALEGRQSVLGKDHPDTFQSMNNLAILLEEQGKHEAAEPLREAARAGQEQGLGLGHPYTIKLNRNQACRLSRKGKHAEAEMLWRGTLEGFKLLKEAGKGDTSVTLGHLEDVNCTEELANCLLAQDKPAEAEHLFRAAVEERSRVLPNDHPDLLKSTTKLANCLWNLEQYGAAEPLYRAVYEGQRQALGLGHPATLSAATDLGKCQQKLERHEEAEAMFRIVTRELQQQRGPDDADTLAAAAALARSLSGQGKLCEAEQQLKDVFSSRERVLGPDHPDTLRSLEDLIKCLMERDNTGDLETYKKKKVELLASTHGLSDKQTIDAYVSLGVSLYNQGLDCQDAEQGLGKFKEAEVQYKKAVEAYAQILGGDHLDTVECLKKQAKSVWAQDGRETDAITLMDDVMERCTRALGPDHPDTIQIRETKDKWVNT